MNVMRWYENGLRAAVAGAFALVIGWCVGASAQGFSVTITVDNVEVIPGVDCIVPQELERTAMDGVTP